MLHAQLGSHVGLTSRWKQCIQNEALYREKAHKSIHLVFSQSREHTNMSKAKGTQDISTSETRADVFLEFGFKCHTKEKIESDCANKEQCDMANCVNILCDHYTFSTY